MENTFQAKETKQYNFDWLSNFIIIAGKLSFKFIRFILYVVVSFLEMIIRIIKSLLNLEGYKPFKGVSKAYRTRQDIKIKDYIERKTEPHAIVTHNYEFVRNRTFAATYVEIDNLLVDCSKNNIQLNENIAKDVLKKINILIVESERQALSEGYGYAKNTHFRFNEDDAYKEFITDKIMQGIDYKVQNQKLFKEFQDQKRK